jgi:hypothetical protein
VARALRDEYPSASLINHCIWYGKPLGASGLTAQGLALGWDFGCRARSVRSCVLIKPRPKNSFPRPLRMGIQSQGPLQDLCTRFFSRSASRLFFSGSEALLTRCPCEADGIYFFGPSLIRTQERTVGWGFGCRARLGCWV